MAQSPEYRQTIAQMDLQENLLKSAQQLIKEASYPGSKASNVVDVLKYLNHLQETIREQRAEYIKESKKDAAASE